MKKQIILKRALELWKKLILSLNENLNIRCISYDDDDRISGYLFRIYLSPEIDNKISIDTPSLSAFYFYENNQSDFSLEVISEDKKYFNSFKTFNAKVREINEKGYKLITWEESYYLIKELCDSIEKDTIVFPPKP